MCTTQILPCPACLNPDTLPPAYPGDSCDCQVCGYEWKPGPVLEIDGVHPAEYAAQWGDGSNGDGCRYYNCSKQARPGVIIANPDWTREDWRAFARIVANEAGRVRFQAQTEEGRKATGWTLDDAGNLSRLAAWARARVDGPQRFTHYNGESGAEIVRLTEAQVYACSGSGDQGGNVSETLPGVEWLADDETIRAFLKGYGAWDDEELTDPASNKERALWMACNDCAEQPYSYAD